MEGKWARGIRSWLAETVGAVLLAGGLLALGAPVSLADYDTWGMQVTCGNGYHNALQQAQIDNEVTDATDYVGRCNSAVAHRRAWAIPVAGLGALILLAQVKRSARRREMEPVTATHAWSADHPDDSMHDAQVLDRRERSHWEHPLEHEVVNPRHLGRRSGV